MSQCYSKQHVLEEVFDVLFFFELFRDVLLPLEGFTPNNTLLLRGEDDLVSDTTLVSLSLMLLLLLCRENCSFKRSSLSFLFFLLSTDPCWELESLE